MSPRRYSMEKRAAAVEETRHRIVEAALVLHAEKGIIATNWEDIAQRADVSPATVYRHFPSLEDIVTACGERVHALTRPPSPEAGKELFAGLDSLVERVGRLVQELHGFYERGGPNIEAARREAHLLSQLAASVARQHATRDALVREALRPADPDQQTVRIASALTDFPLWKSLRDKGLRKEVVTEVVRQLLLCALGTSKAETGSDRLDEEGEKRWQSQRRRQR